MILYPAIDLKDGKCVRLLRGEMDNATVFSDSPANQARVFEKAGFKWLHVVDLNGAFAGKPVNGMAIKSILARVKIPVQLGGGIRDMKIIAAWLETGISRIVLGTLALREPAIVKEACRLFPGKIAVSIDARDGKVAIGGWAEMSDQLAVDVAKRFEDVGVAAIIYTDINRDGAMEGPNVDETVKLAKSITTPVIASGGISSVDDIKRFKETKTSGIQGCILGRALYEGKIKASAALKLC